MKNRLETLLLTFFVAVSLCLTVPGQHASGQTFLRKLGDVRRSVSKDIFVRRKPHTGRDTAIERLATEIDGLEGYVDKYGSIVAKQPDIWGESRLTKFRAEFESVMVKQLEEFKPVDSAKISLTDAAFLANATALGASLDPGQLPTNLNPSLGAGNQIATTVTPGSGTTPPTQNTTITQSIGAPGALGPRTFSGLTAANNLEPTTRLNQLSRYLNHLHQIRRISDGDDTSDAPGYALNLVRIPVSILPGRETRRGHGAEITITANPYTSEALLPTSFRNLVVNDLVDQLSLPILRLAESDQIVADVAARDFAEKYRHEINQIYNIGSLGKKPTIEMILQNMFGIGDLSINLGKLANMANDLDQVLTTLKNDDLRKKVAKQLAWMKWFVAKGDKDWVPSFAAATNAEQLEWVNLARLTDQDKKHFDEFEKEFPEAAAAIVATVRREMEEVDQSGGDGLESMQQELDEVSLEKLATYLRNIALSREAEIKTIDYYQIAPPEFREDDQVPDEGFENELNLDPEKGPSSGSRESSRRLQRAPQIQMSNDVEDMFREQVELQAGQLSPAGRVQQFLGTLSELTSQVDKVFRKTQVAVNPVSRRRRSRYPIPSTLLTDVIGQKQLLDISLEFRKSYSGRHVAWNGQKDIKPRVHLGDMRHHLSSSLESAYTLVAQSQNRPLLEWAIEPGATLNGLAKSIEQGDVSSVNHVRQNVMSQLQAQGTSSELLRHLAWCIFVEMALLNDQLNLDVHSIAVTRGDCGCHPHHRCKYYLPMPQSHEEWEMDQEFRGAAQQFQNYVKCRWPIHVFAVDPVNEEQNVPAASQMRRELSVAVSLAFINGQINFQQMNQFNRQVQEDIEAIELNRTVTGFAHGNDTFGWRFSPRIQTHKNRGNLQAFAETLVGRGADSNKREAELESGIRECTAIVLMPSFVPYCDFDVRSNWYRLDNPRQSELSMHATMKLSRNVKAMQNSAHECVQCQHLYRDGELERLLSRVDQLEAELPMQSMRSQIPYENTLGGFELFSNGLTDLAPELVGWYGAPGVEIGGEYCCAKNCNEATVAAPAATPAPNTGNVASTNAYAAGTTMFLVGDNFSVHETKVIVGGVEIPREHVKLLSRQIMQVTIPNCVRTVTFEDTKYVAVYASTPYGVTSHMHIPANEQKDKSKSEKAAVSKGDLAKAVVDLKKELAETDLKWKNDKDKLELAFSYSDGVDKPIRINAVELAKSNAMKKVPFQLPGNPTRVPNSAPAGECAIFAQIYNGDEKVGDSFMIARRQLAKAPNAKFIFSTIESDPYFTMQQLAEACKDQLQLGITKEGFGNKEVIELTMVAYMVYVDTVDADGNIAQSSNPVRFEKSLPVVLIQREKPTKRQQE